MRRIRNRVAGLDVHRDSVTGCVECFDGVDVEVTKQRSSTTATGIRELADWLPTRRLSPSWPRAGCDQRSRR